MPTLLDKDRTVDLLATEFAAVTSLLWGLADGQWEVGTCLPG